MFRAKLNDTCRIQTKRNEKNSSSPFWSDQFATHSMLTQFASKYRLINFNHQLMSSMLIVRAPFPCAEKLLHFFEREKMSQCMNDERK